jgi:hypothetical protein
MKSLVVWTATLVYLAASVSIGNAHPAGCPASLPAGTIIRIFLDEKLTAGITSGPIMFTVGSDVRLFPNGPPLLPRGAKVAGQVVESQQAGRLLGKARSHIVLTSILTSDFCEYSIDAKILTAGSFNVEDNVVYGRGHAKRDALLLSFPPTTLYQVLRIPGRGPKLVLDTETPLTIKLMQPLYPDDAASSANESELNALRARIDQLERHISSLETAAFKTSTSPGEEPRLLIAAPCAATAVNSSIRPIAYKDTVLRPVRNATPYHVRLFLNGIQVALLPPCYGSMVAMPTYAFHLESEASLLTSDGQTQVEVRIVPNIDENGWDIVWDRNQPVPVSANR